MIGKSTSLALVDDTLLMFTIQMKVKVWYDVAHLGMVILSRRLQIRFE